MVGEYQGKKYFLGSSQMMFENWLKPTKKEKQVVYFATEEKILADIILEDQMKDSAKETISSLSDVKTVILSGDAKSPVKYIAKRCGIQDYH